MHTKTPVLVRPRLSSDSQFVTRVVPPFAVEIADGLMDDGFEVVEIPEGAMGEEMALQVAPRSFDPVQFRDVFRQPLHGQPGAFRERRRRGPAGVDRSVVQHQDDGPAATARARPELPVATSIAPSIATLRDWPGAATRRSAPLRAQAWAR